MADQSIIPTVADFASLPEKIGWGLAVICGLVFVLKLLTQAYLKAMDERIKAEKANTEIQVKHLTSRIDALEKALVTAQDENQRLNTELLRRTDMHVEELKEVHRETQAMVAKIIRKAAGSGEHAG